MNFACNNFITMQTNTRSHSYSLAKHFADKKKWDLYKYLLFETGQMITHEKRNSKRTQKDCIYIWIYIVYCRKKNDTKIDTSSPTVTFYESQQSRSTHNKCMLKMLQTEIPNRNEKEKKTESLKTFYYYHFQHVFWCEMSDQTQPKGL